MARDFTSTTDHIEFGNTTWPSTGSFSLWAKTNWVETENAIHDFCSVGGGTNLFAFFKHNNSQGNVTQVGWRTSGTFYWTSQLLTYTVGQWYHFACKWNDSGAGSISLFRDNAAAGSLSSTATHDTSSNARRIGRILLQARSPDMAMAEFVMWDREISSGEIAYLAAGGLPLKLGPTEYLPLWGLHDPEINLANGGTSGTNFNTTKATGNPPVKHLELFTPLSQDQQNKFTSVISEQIRNGHVTRSDLNIADSGDAVIAKVIAGTGVSLSETGADAGTGDVTITSTDLPRGFISSLTLSNNGIDSDHDIDISTGNCRDSTNAASLPLTSSITKQIDANWAVGSDAGGFPSALTLTADTWYHVFLIRSSGGVVDAGFDTSISATNLLSDSGYTTFRRIGSVLTDGSSNILGFTQIEDHFIWDASIEDQNIATFSSTSALFVISTPPSVSTMADISISIGDSVTANPLVHAQYPDSNTEAAAEGLAVGRGIATSVSGEHRLQVRTNTSSQVRLDTDTNNSDLTVRTYGWIDARGRNESDFS